MNTGGPAFPNITPDMPVDGAPGVTLRDYFASQAPLTFADAVVAADINSNAPDIETGALRALQNEHARKAAFEMLAKLQGEYADAMLRIREEA